MAEFFNRSGQIEKSILIGADRQTEVVTPLIHAAYARIEQINATWHDDINPEGLIDRVRVVHNSFKANWNNKMLYAMPLEERHIADAMGAYLLAYVGMPKLESDEKVKENFRTVIMAVCLVLESDYQPFDTDNIEKEAIERARLLMPSLAKTKTLNDPNAGPKNTVERLISFLERAS